MSNYIVTTNVNAAGFFDNYSFVTSTTIRGSITVTGGSDMFGILNVLGNVDVNSNFCGIGDDYFDAIVSVNNSNISTKLITPQINSHNVPILFAIEGTNINTSNLQSGNIVVDHFGTPLSSASIRLFSIDIPLNPPQPNESCTIFSWNSVDDNTYGISFTNDASLFHASGYFAFGFQKDASNYSLTITANIGDSTIAGSSEYCIIGTQIFGPDSGQTVTIADGLIIGHNILNNFTTTQLITSFIFIGNNGPTTFPQIPNSASVIAIGNDQVWTANANNRHICFIGNSVSKPNVTAIQLKPLFAIGHNSGGDGASYTIIGAESKCNLNNAEILICGYNNTASANTQVRYFGHDLNNITGDQAIIWGGPDSANGITEYPTAVAGVVEGVPGNPNRWYREQINSTTVWIPLWTTV